MIHSMELLGRVVLLDGLNNEVGFQIGNGDGDILYMVVDDKGAEYSGEPHLDPETVIEECDEANANEGHFKYSIVVREYTSNNPWMPADLDWC